MRSSSAGPVEPQIVLLRGINLGAHNRVSMPALREALTGAGFEEVSTYLQSGNVVLAGKRSGEELERDCERLIEDVFGLRIDVVVRSQTELASVVERNPLAEVATNPKRYQVTFLAAPLSEDRAELLRAAAIEPERLVIDGRELYAWHPDGVARSKLWNSIAGKGLGVKGTSRNWTTIRNLMTMAEEIAA